MTATGAGRRGLLSGPPHHREGEPVPGRGARPPADRLVRAGEDRRALTGRSPLARRPVSWCRPSSLAGVPAAQRASEAKPDPGARGDRGGEAGGSSPRRLAVGRADHLLDDQESGPRRSRYIRKAHPAWEADAAEGAGPGTGRRPVDARTGGRSWSAAPIAVLAAMTVVIGLYGPRRSWNWPLDCARRNRTLDPTPYVAAVL